jgi:hypothetical protein
MAAEFRETDQICGFAPLRVDLLRLALAAAANEGSNTMPPTDLNVPFHEKDDAKRLGARWDAIRKTWFLPDCTEIVPRDVVYES